MNIRKRFSIFTILLASTALALGTAACSSDDDDKGGAPPHGDGNGQGGDGGGGGENGDGDGKGGEGGEGGEGGAGGSGGGGGGGGSYTLENICEQVAAKQCSDFKDCCESSGYGYSEAGCIANSISQCEEQLALVQEGKRTFHPEAVDGCLDAMREIADKCEYTLTETLELRDLGQECGYVFAGTVEPGGACDDVEECKPPADSSQKPVCDDQVCVHVPRVLSEGDACSFSFDCGPTQYCEKENAADEEGKCKKRESIGGTCEGGVFSDECVIGAYCDQGTKKCAASKPFGDACTFAIECASFQCDEGTCEEEETFTFGDVEMCTGEADDSAA